MTREEAAKMIKDDIRLHHGYLSGKYRRALNLAIKALQQPEPCEDAVSREAVLDKAYAYGNGLEPEGYCVNVEDIQALPSVTPKRMPPAQPERPRGEWINRSLNIIYPDWERYTCSACGKHAYNYDFCPNCGADMRGEDHDEG